MKNSKKAKKLWIRKTYSCKVTPQESDLSNLEQVNGTLVQLWNVAVEICHQWLQSPEKKFITPISLNFWLTGARSNESSFQEVSVVLEREMLRRLAGSFGSYFALKKKKDSQARLPQPKNPEKSFIALTWPAKSFAFQDGVLRGSLGSKRTAVFTAGDYITNVLKKLPTDSSIAQVTVSKRDGEYWANFVCNIPRPEDAPTKGIVGIDLGSGDIVCCTSDGIEFSFAARRPDKMWRKEIHQVENRLEGCKKGSRAWLRRNRARKIMHRKGLYQHTDHQRKLAHWIVTQGYAVVVGKMKTRLGLAQSEGTRDQHWGVQSTGYAFRLLLFLKEKASEHGINLLEFPDPPRKDLGNPEKKFASAHTLLKKGCEQLKINFPQIFKRIDFSFPQG